MTSQNVLGDRKALHEITRDEWIAFDWIDITTYGDNETILLRGMQRIPSEGGKAARDWDIWIGSAQRMAALTSEMDAGI